MGLIRRLFLFWWCFLRFSVRNPGLDSFAKGLLEEFGQLFGSLVQSGQWTLTVLAVQLGSRALRTAAQGPEAVNLSNKGIISTKNL